MNALKRRMLSLCVALDLGYKFLWWNINNCAFAVFFMRDKTGWNIKRARELDIFYWRYLFKKFANFYV